MAALLAVSSTAGAVTWAGSAASTSGAAPLRAVVRGKAVYPPAAQYKGYQDTGTFCFTVTGKGAVTDLGTRSHFNLSAPAWP